MEEKVRTSGQSERRAMLSASGRRRDRSGVSSPTKQLSVNWEVRLGGCIGCYPSIDGRRTCTASAVFPTPPSPRTATLQLSMLSYSWWGEYGMISLEWNEGEEEGGGGGGRGEPRTI